MKKNYRHWIISQRKIDTKGNVLKWKAAYHCSSKVKQFQLQSWNSQERRLDLGKDTGKGLASWNRFNRFTLHAPTFHFRVFFKPKMYGLLLHRYHVLYDSTMRVCNRKKYSAVLLCLLQSIDVSPLSFRTYFWQLRGWYLSGSIRSAKNRRKERVSAKISHYIYQKM